MFKKTAFAAAAFASLAAGTAYAATTTTTLNTSVTIAPSCTSVSVPAIAFGTIGGTSSLQQQSSTITVTCSSGTPFTLGLGRGAGVDTANRVLTGTTPSNTMTYQLTDGAGLNWDDIGGTHTLSGSGATTFAVFAKIPVQTQPAADTYSDTVIVTVSY